MHFASYIFKLNLYIYNIYPKIVNIKKFDIIKN